MTPSATIAGVEGEKRVRAHVARLDLNRAQSAALDGQAHCARALWNLLHEYTTFRQGRLASLKDCDEAIRAARREISWLNDLPAQAAQAVLKTYRRAWANFFDPKHPGGRPAFKGRLRSRMAVDVPQARDLRITRINRRWGAVNLPKIGRVRLRWTKDLPGVTKGSPPGRITGARLVKDALGWHIVFRTERHVPVPAPHRGPKVGMDRGIAVPLALSTGEHLTHGPWLTGGEQARLLRLERASARRRAHRTKGAPASNREQRSYDQIARLRAKAKRRALDWQHKSTTTLAERFSVIVVEDLRIVNMMASAAGTVDEPGRGVAQKRGLNRAIAGEAWGRTVDLLTYKAADRGGLVAKVPPHGTSRQCHRCHTTVPGSRESQARFVCKNPACGWIGNADTNAARNQLHRYITAAGRAVTGRGDSEVSGSVKRQASCPTVSPAPAPRAAA
ncbi:RNA-guided endonuclease InsQ/TnpB family protein [Nonomuraea wenchangensis]|uniref:RNA-guided endonuclease InsQ/TnpB family protein n=1 Tax=Nonomuraea wenchangensis TaxID=568860 RepID=UPI0033E2173F